MGIVDDIKHWFARRLVREGINDERMTHAEGATMNVEIEAERLREALMRDRERDPLNRFMRDLGEQRGGGSAA